MERARAFSKELVMLRSDPMASRAGATMDEETGESRVKHDTVHLLVLVRLVTKNWLTAEDCGPFPLHRPLLWVSRIVRTIPCHEVRVSSSSRRRRLLEIEFFAAFQVSSVLDAISDFRYCPRQGS